VVGVRVGRDDNTSLGKVSGGTVPARIWRDFMSSALSVDHSIGPDLPRRYAPSNNHPPAVEHPSPLPPEWSDVSKPLRDMAKALRRLVQ